MFRKKHNSTILQKELSALKRKQNLRAKQVKTEVKPEVKAEPLSMHFVAGDVIDLT